MSRRHGFTLIELSAVVLVLALLAAFLTPNLGRSLVANQRRNYRAGLLRMVADARRQAAQTGTAITMGVSDDGAFQLSAVNADNEENVLSTLAPIDGVEASGLYLKDGTEAGNDWLVKFYPDGTSDGGAIDISENGDEIRYQIQPATGLVAIVSTDTEFQEDRWPAGEFTGGG